MDDDTGREPFVIDIVTLFPEVVSSFLDAGIMGRAVAEGRLKIVCTNPRDFATDAHRTVDDSPSGGGPGMVMKIEPVVGALEAIAASRGEGHRVLLSPSGRPFDQETATRFAGLDHLVLLCGRYEGIDDRVREQFCDECVSLGDFVLNGGEVAALAVVESVGRLLQGVVRNPDSIALESFSRTGGGALEHPQYTRPADFRGFTVPAPLSSGDHPRVQRWRDAVSRIRTRRLRPEFAPEVRASAEHGPGLDVAVVVDARAGEGVDVGVERLASLAIASSGSVVVWTDRAISPGPGVAVLPAETKSLPRIRKILRGKRKSRLLVVPVAMPGESVPAWRLTEPAEVFDVALTHGAAVAAENERGAICAVFVIAPEGSPLRSALAGGDPPSDFLLDLGDGAAPQLHGNSGVENGAGVINPSQPQPAESIHRDVARQLQHFLERWTQDFHST